MFCFIRVHTCISKFSVNLYNVCSNFAHSINPQFAITCIEILANNSQPTLYVSIMFTFWFTISTPCVGEYKFSMTFTFLVSNHYFHPCLLALLNTDVNKVGNILP